MKSVTSERWLPAKDSTIYSATPSVTVDETYSLDQSMTNVFDEQGRSKSWSVKESEGGKKKKMKEQAWAAYYQGNAMTATVRYDDGKLADSVYRHYRKNGLKDYELSFDGKKEMALREDFVYKNGILFSSRKRDAKGQPISSEKRRYKDGRLLEAQHFDGSSKKTDTWRFSYLTTPEGHLTTNYAILNGDGKLRSGRMYTTDSAGRTLVSNDISDEREVTEYNSFTYNNQGDAETEKLFNSAVERHVTNRYVYDGRGNWTKQEIFYNDILYAVSIRKIEYFGE